MTEGVQPLHRFNTRLYTSLLKAQRCACPKMSIVSILLPISPAFGTISSYFALIEMTLLSNFSVLVWIYFKYLLPGSMFLPVLVNDTRYALIVPWKGTPTKKS